MAKRKPTKTTKERGKLLRQIRSMEKRGYRFSEKDLQKIKSGKYYQTFYSYTRDNYKKLYSVATAEINGKTVTGYVNEKRIELAQELLKTTNLQIQTIAQYCGIVDVHYFTRLFKKTTGVSPKQYREENSK